MNKKTVVLLISLISTNSLLSIWPVSNESQNKIKEIDQQLNANRLEREKNRKEYLEKKMQKKMQRIDKKLQEEPNNIKFIDKKILLSKNSTIRTNKVNFWLK